MLEFDLTELIAYCLVGAVSVTVTGYCWGSAWLRPNHHPRTFYILLGALLLSLLTCARLNTQYFVHVSLWWMALAAAASAACFVIGWEVAYRMKLRGI